MSALSTIERRESGALLAAVAVAAISGIVYELLLGTTASFLLGDSITEWSLTIGTFLAAMGVGSWMSRYVGRRLLSALVAVEVATALLGGFSIVALFAVFAWAEPVFRPAFYFAIFAIGGAVGLEIPLLTRAIKRYGNLRTVLSSVLALDYGGALLASVLYPLLLYPVLGLARTALAASVFNLLGAALILYAHRRRGEVRRGHVLAVAATAGLVLVGLGAAAWATSAIDRRLYRPEELVYAERSPYQHLALTRSRSGTTQLYLNGHLQFHSRDEARYHETLVHVPVAMARDPRRVLILGGGDGLAARELLKYPGIERIVLVDLDPAVTGLAARHPLIERVNEGALSDARVTVINDDALRFLRQAPPESAGAGAFDLVIFDLPDPSTPELGRLYTVQAYRLAAARLAPQGVIAVQAGSPYFARDAYWCVVSTLEAAGLRTLPYHVNVPSFGEWGFVAARLEPPADPAGLRVRVPTRFLTDAVLPGLFVFPPDMARTEQAPHTLLSPRLTGLFQRGWRQHAF